MDEEGGLIELPFVMFLMGLLIALGIFLAERFFGINARWYFYIPSGVLAFPFVLMMLLSLKDSLS
ncbi:MAG: hypothetical protein KAR83_03905 [Thermodesulfovibrionales bacterium]|nr:hypothetical protein [Thermodesulfovibrionales bacterium]